MSPINCYFKSISFHEQDERISIRKKFEQQGIEPERLIILDWVEGRVESSFLLQPN